MKYRHGQYEGPPFTTPGRLPRLTKVIAYYCSRSDLGSTVIQSYLGGKKRTSFVS